MIALDASCLVIMYEYWSVEIKRMTNIMLIDTLASPSMCVSEILLNFVDVISFSNKIFQVLYIDDSVSA
jgi:hypothetical protein